MILSMFFYGLYFITEYCNKFSYKCNRRTNVGKKARSIDMTWEDI